MRAAAGVLTALLLLAAVQFRADSEVPVDRIDPTAPPQQTAAGSHWIKLTFGLDEKAVPWDGQVSAVAGAILQTVPWSFEERDRFDPVAHRWFCTTVVLQGRSASSFAEPARGVLVEIQRDSETKLDVETRQGQFSVDVAALVAGVPSPHLEGRATAELLGTSASLAQGRVARSSVAEREDDFPSLAVDGDGHRWLAWIGYEADALCDHLSVMDLDDPQAGAIEIPTAREQLNPKLVTDGDGNLWLFWSAPAGDGNWDLWATKRTGAAWEAAKQISTEEGTDFHLSAARGPKGEIWLAWQAFRNGNSDILVRRLDAGRWSPEIVVAASDANEWEPSLSVDPTGRAWIGYDSYINGNYDVFLTSLNFDAQGRANQGKTIGVATSADFEAHAAVEAGDGSTVWVAFDAAGPNWGKDYTREATTHKGEYAAPLHASRRLGLRAVVDGELLEPAVPLPQKLGPIRPTTVTHSNTDARKRFYELPHLVRDGSGRLWVFFRLNRQGYAGHPKRGAHWEFFATTFTGGTWLEPILIPLSSGRQNQQLATALDRDGNLQLAWSTGHHLIDKPQRVRWGTMPTVSGDPSPPRLVPVTAITPMPTMEPLVRGWEMQHRGETYDVYFGDLHRHTDISLCTPTIDGCLVDAYRYALDAVRYDFLAVTDHTRDTDPYPWWRTQKANDLFYVKGTFAPIYGYERSNDTAGGGHRNVFFLERDWPVLRGDAHYSSTSETKPENNDPDVGLYPHLRGKNAFTAAHTPNYNEKAQRGTWTFHDPQVEPLAEIIQSYRRDYERAGAPQWPDARFRRGISEEASLWYALARGYKLGFIASSDHHATHTSYACVWAAGPSREEIFEGLRSRRTYAATDKIILEVRMDKAVMGEEIDGPEIPELRIRVRGTAPIEEIQVVRNSRVIAELSPKKIETTAVVRDEEYSGGAAYYYARVRQVDNNMAWGSPIWVK
jgi:hypothetical protein